MKWVYDAQRELTKSGTDTSALILSYQLTPHGQYPLQLQQAVNLVKHVIEVEGLSPSQVSHLRRTSPVYEYARDKANGFTKRSFLPETRQVEICVSPFSPISCTLTQQSLK
jgi:hypothetical protein